MKATGENAFRALRIEQRLNAVRREGEYLGSRIHGGHQVHLYRMEGFFCEVWMRIGLHEVEWIEVVTNSTILSEYVHLDLSGILGPEG